MFDKYTDVTTTGTGRRKHVITIAPHGGIYRWGIPPHGERQLYLQRGKCAPGGKLLEGGYIRELLALMNQQEDYYFHVIDAGMVESGPMARARAVNMLVDELGGPDRCIYLELHCNAAGKKGKWNKAQGHKTFHNGKGQALKIARNLDATLTARSPLETQSRGVTKRFFTAIKMVKCAAVLEELCFMDNRVECRKALDYKMELALLLQGWVGNVSRWGNGVIR